MSTIEWRADGTPISPRFDDIYRSEGDGAEGALIQTREIFLGGCDLPRSWRGLEQWRILETGFGLGLNFLAAWHAWRADPERSRMLHFVSVEAWPVSAEDIVRSAAPFAELHELADRLAAQWFGLIGGFHRLVFDGGLVTLTLCIGDAKAMLRDMSFKADAVFLDGFNPALNPDMWDAELISLVAERCRSGTRIATWTVARNVRDALTEAGFAIAKKEGAPPKRHSLMGRFHTPKPQQSRALDAGHCVVVGAGISGASVAASLARRGWRVTVVDKAPHAAAGASALPAGLVTSHVSPDDAIVSRLTRAGVRATLNEAGRRLRSGTDWARSGVLHRTDLNKKPSGNVATGHGPWFEKAESNLIDAAGLPDAASALWHEHAAWLSPRTLVVSWLADPKISLIADCAVAGGSMVDGKWLLTDSAGASLDIEPAEALVIACADGAKELFEAITHRTMALSAVRGQLSLGALDESVDGSAVVNLPPSPINGHGTLIADVPLGSITGQDAQARVWLAGSTFERGDPLTDEAAHEENLKKLVELWPPAATNDSMKMATGIWKGTRCVSRDRLPAVGAPLPGEFPGLFVSTAMGSRGLTLAALCAEVLAASIHAEPLPIEQRLAEALSAERLVIRVS